MFASVINNLAGPFVGNSVADRVVQFLIVACIAVLSLYLLDRVVELLSPKVTKRVDVATTGENALRLRRAETLVGLSITLLRILIVVAAVLVIWYLNNPKSGPVALIGVGTVGIVLGGATIAPLLRDMTYGYIMIAERWYGVGDHVVFEPFYGNNSGVVERMSLRSTKLRTVNGEVIWMHHQHIQAVHVTGSASHPLIIETFVNDPEKGRKIIEDAIDILPRGATTIPQPPEITEIKKVKPKIWRITAVCEVTPFREWMVDEYACKVIRKTDALTGDDPVIVHGPLSYYSDDTAEKRYHRTAKVRQLIRYSKTKAAATKAAAAKPPTKKQS